MVKVFFFVLFCFFASVSEATNVFKNLTGEMTSPKSKALNRSKRKKETCCCSMSPGRENEKSWLNMLGKT